MRMGISTACLYPMELEKSLDKLLSMDFHLVEIFFNTWSEIELPFIKTLKEILSAYGAGVKSIHPFTSGFEGFLFFSNYERRRRDALEFYKKYFEAANRLGASIVVLHGQKDYHKKGVISEEEYFEHYLGLYRLGQEYGITVAQENVNLFRSESPEFIRKMRIALGEECAFVLDVKQAVRAQKNPFEMCAAMGDRTVHVHLNDNYPGQDCVLPGVGTMDFIKLKKMLLSYHFDGDLIIEVYRKSFGNLSELDDAKQVVEQLIKKNT